MQTLDVHLPDALIDLVRSSLWLAMTEGGDMAANAPNRDDRIPIGPPDV